MNLKKVAVFAALSLVASLAFASTNIGGGCTGNCANNGNPGVVTNTGGQGGAGGMGVGIGVGGSASALGGAANVRDSGNSSNTNLNDLSNRNSNQQGQTQTAKGGNATGGNAAQSSVNNNQSSASNQNSNSNAGNNSTQSVSVGGSTYNAARIPVATAVAPNNYPTAACMGSSSAGVQGMSFGVSLGSSWKDENCQFLEQVRTVGEVLEDRDTAAEMMCAQYPAYREARKRIGKACAE